MTQRGISRSMIDLVLEYGQLEQDKAILNRKHAQELIRELEEKLRTAKKILDKGGCVVIETDNAILTTYNYPSKH
jgi:exonuclease VII small subunit